LGTTYVLKNDESISRKHCTFLLNQNELRIIDDGAKYGTTIQNTEINKISKEPMTLKDGDKVQFGCYGNIWEVHCKQESRGGIKRKSDNVETIENSLSISNISKKPKENPINAKIVDKFDIIIDSDDDMPKSSRSSRHRAVPVNTLEISRKRDHENEVCSSDIVNKQQTKKSSGEVLPTTSQISRKIDLEGDVFNFDILNKHQIKTPRNMKKNENANSEEVIADISQTSRKRENEVPNINTHNKSQPKKPRNVKNNENASNGVVPATTSHISRKRDLEDDVFNFDIPTKHQIKKPRHLKNNENASSERVTAATSVSSAKSFSYKTSKISDKEAFGSFVYDIDEDAGTWLSTRVSNIKVKDEGHDEMDNSASKIIVPPYSVNANIVRKKINLDTTAESKKCFQKQKYLESDKVVTLRKLNVQDLNYCYNKKEEESREDWS